jgi:hypothetical protein
LTLGHLNTFAYCLASQCQAVARASGATPLTSPPMVASAFPRRLLEGRDLLYLALHGMPGQPYFYGDTFETALSVTAIEGLDLSATVVFCTSCHFTESPWLPAFLACNPRMLIGGDGPNYARNVTPVGAHLLGHHLRRALAAGLKPEWAFAYAQHRLRRAVSNPTHHVRRRLAEDLTANQDALLFRAYTPGGYHAAPSHEPE